jgi:hypothetical protein
MGAFRFRVTKKAFFRPFVRLGQPCSIASFGQVSAQVPQSMQTSASISYLPSPSEIASTGHSPAQAPQEMQASVMIYAMVATSGIFYHDHCNYTLGKMQ